MTVTASLNPRGNVVLRTNEVVNPRIDGQTGWQNLWFGSGGTGTNSFKPHELDMAWTNTPTGSVEDAGWRYHHSGFTAGLQKTCSAYFWPAGFAPSAAVKARYYNASGTLISYDTSSTVALANNNAGGPGWQRISGTFTPPAGTTYTDVDFVLMAGNKPSSGSTLAIQNALIEPGATLSPYFDGDTYAAGNGSQFTTWAGTQYNSQSKLWDIDPATLFSPLLVLGWESQQAATNLFHTLLSGAVVGVQRPATPRSGVLHYFFGHDRAAAMNCRVQHAKPGTWTYADTDLPETGMTYMVNGAVHTLLDDSRLNWTVEVPFQEVL